MKKRTITKTTEIETMKVITPATKKPETWGRASSTSTLTVLITLCIFIFSPLLIHFYYYSAQFYDLSLTDTAMAFIQGHDHPIQLFTFLPIPSLPAIKIYFAWMFIQVVLALIPDYLHKILPGYDGGSKLGAVTPAGNRLWYEINGLQAWAISQVLFLVAPYVIPGFEWSFYFDHWPEFLVLATSFGFVVATFAYIKAHTSPSHPADRKWTGSVIYDYFMGVELNPRVGALDLKLFFNGRPGIVAWTIINMSYAAAQYNRYGYITNSMIMVNYLHALYVLYFFYKESWYLNTIDIHHDHFGWYLGWGDSVWLPFMYTLQGFYLVYHPIHLSSTYAAFVTVLGTFAFYLFLSSNNQKDLFSKTDGDCYIWGQRPKYIQASYTTTDGKKRERKLLLSGWWGVSRHLNYTADLVGALCYSLSCGVDHIFPYFYITFLTILLIHRCFRDEQRCSAKYGQKWKEYCERVPTRLIPGVF